MQRDFLIMVSFAPSVKAHRNMLLRVHQNYKKFCLECKSQANKLKAFGYSINCSYKTSKDGSPLLKTFAVDESPEVIWKEFPY